MTMFVVVRLAGQRVSTDFSKLATGAANFSTSLAALQQKVSPRLSQTIQTIRPQIKLKHYGQVVPFAGVAQRGIAVAAREEDGSCPIQYVPEEPRPLAVLLAWLSAQDKHIEKYRSIWFQRGFDVLTMEMTYYDFLLPTRGAHVLVKDLIKFLYEVVPIYPEMIIQGFSVGGYGFGEFLTHLNDKEFMKTIKRRDGVGDPKETVEKAIRGVIVDSLVTFEGIARGVSRSMSSNPTAVRLFEAYINSHLRIAYPIATKHYIRASDNAHQNYLKVPGLLFASKADPIGNVATTTHFGNMWQERGNDTQLKVFEDSKHVQHYSTYPEEYIAEIDSFLRRVKLTTRATQKSISSAAVRQ